jgi:hypothetical protein
MIPTTYLEDSHALARTSLCSYCQSNFIRPQTLQLLASKTGLYYTRKKSSILRTAIDGCRLCRELLCMPKYTKVNGEKIIPPFSYTRHRWPLQTWEDDLQKLTGQRPLSMIFSRDRTLHFCWKGNPQFQRYLEVSRLQNALLFEIAVAYGMLQIYFSLRDTFILVLN